VTPLTVAHDRLASLGSSRPAESSRSSPSRASPARAARPTRADALRLWDGDRPAGDGRPQGRLKLAEAGLPLHDPPQVVLIEVEELHQRSEICLAGGAGGYAPSASAALS
jgi:hypothetical protein